MSTLKSFKCSVFNPATECEYSVTGEENIIVEEAAVHEMTEHGYEDTPQLRKDIKDSLIDDSGS
jgi:hypothetical protein